jgi:hypothetical protein
VGENIEDVSRFQNHSSPAVTMVYLKRLEGETDKSWVTAAEAIGILLTIIQIYDHFLHLLAVLSHFQRLLRLPHHRLAGHHD